MSDGPLVLVVDDESQIRRFLRISLEGNGYRVFESETGQDALAKAAQHRPDVIPQGFLTDEELALWSAYYDRKAKEQK